MNSIIKLFEQDYSKIERKKNSKDIVEIFKILLSQEYFEVRRVHIKKLPFIKGSSIIEKLNKLDKYRNLGEYNKIIRNIILIPLVKKRNEVLKKQNVLINEGSEALNEINLLISKEQEVYEDVKTVISYINLQSMKSFRDVHIIKCKSDLYLYRTDFLIGILLFIIVSLIFILGGLGLNPVTFLP